MPGRVPYNSKYCKEVKCQYLHGNKCTIAECVAKGGVKWARFWTDNGHLPNGSA